MERAYTCSRCGAPLEVTPETIIAICPYCGFPTVLSGVVDVNDVYILPAVQPKIIEERFQRELHTDFDLRRIRNEITPRRIEGVYVPLWVAEVYVKGVVSYYYYVTRNKKRKKIYRVENIDKNILLKLVARRQIATLGVNELEDTINREALSKSKKLIEVTPEEWSTIKLEVLNTEFDKKSATERIREDAVDYVRKSYEEKGTIDGFNVSSKVVEDPFLLLVPLWYMYYQYRDSIYYMVFSGWDGRLLVKTEPVTSTRRIMYLAGSILSVLSASALAYLVYLSSKSSNELGASLLLPLIPVYFAFHLGRQIIKDIRIER